MFLEHQISILEWFLKDHLTLKAGVVIVSQKYKTIKYNVKYKTIILNCNYISQLDFYCDQIMQITFEQ